MPLVADTSAPDPAGPVGKLVADPDAPAPPKPNVAMEAAKTWGSAAVRQPTKAAIYASTFIPDVATTLGNAIANAVDKGAQYANRAITGNKADIVQSEPDVETPSSFLLGKLDQVTQKPTGIGRVAEEVGAIGMSGGVELAAATARAAPKVIGHLVKKGLTMITTKAAEDAHIAGYNISPSYVGGKVAKSVQAVTGGGKVDRVLSEQNQAVHDRLAKSAIGLHPNEEPTDHALELLGEEAEKGYDALGSMGRLPPDPVWEANVKAAGGRFANLPEAAGGGARFKAVGDEKARYIKKEPPAQEADKTIRTKTEWGYKFDNIVAQKAPFQNAPEMTAQEAVDEVRALRSTARGNLRIHDPEKNALGAVQREIADKLDERLSRRAAALAKAGVIPQDVYATYEKSRQQLAKIALYRDSLGPGGHVIAETYAKAKKAGIQLSDGFDKIASFAENFPRNAQFGGKAGSEGPFSPLDFLLGGTGVIYHHPLGLGLAVARPAARASIGTKAVQGAMIKGAPRLAKGAKAVALGTSVRATEAVGERKKKDPPAKVSDYRNTTSDVHPLNRILDALVPSAGAADLPAKSSGSSKMIGGLPATVDAKGNMKVLGIDSSIGQTQDYIDRLKVSIAHNKETMKNLPPEFSKSLKPLFDDMQARLDNAQEILAKAKAIKKIK